MKRARPRSPFLLAERVILFLAGGLLAWGVKLLIFPPIYQTAKGDIFSAPYEGYAFLLLALLLIWFRRPVAARLFWLFQEIYRWISALLLAGALGIDGLMHVFNIPHMEGWWIPIFGGGALVTAITAWLQKFKKRQD